MSSLQELYFHLYNILNDLTLSIIGLNHKQENAINVKSISETLINFIRSFLHTIIINIFQKRRVHILTLLWR